MDKITFLNELEHQLHRLPNQVADQIMNQYENHFFKENEKGKTDSEILKTLDSPKQIAKKKYAKYAVKDAEKKPDFNHLRRCGGGDHWYELNHTYFCGCAINFSHTFNYCRYVYYVRYGVSTTYCIDYKSLCRFTPNFSE